MTTLRTTSRDYARPHRPRGIRVANAVLRALGPLGRASLDEGSLLRAARRAERLDDFGDEGFRVPLQRLLTAIADEARLSPVGRFITRVRLVGLLRNRLRARALFTAHPEIQATHLAPPVVITGLQRTGTTFLHRLLAADPRFRTLASWEALNPAPWPGKPLGPPDDPRIAAAKQAERGLAYLSPDFFAVHPVQAESPEEEVLLLDQSFLSTVAEATLRVPSFSSWLETQDQTPAYEGMKHLLQLLQWQRGADRWLLKTPHHLEWIDTLLAVFPGTRIIWTHRDPVETVASFCSMVAHGRGVFSDRVDPHEIGRDWSRKVSRMLERAMASRERRDGEGFVDVMYTDLVADPMATVRRIYTKLDLSLSAEIETRIDATRQASPQHRYGRHVYGPEDFDLSAATIAEHTTAYRMRHGYTAI